MTKLEFDPRKRLPESLGGKIVDKLGALAYFLPGCVGDFLLRGEDWGNKQGAEHFRSLDLSKDLEDKELVSYK